MPDDKLATTPPRQRGRASKREAILAAAIDHFQSRGYDLTSMDAVAAGAGVSKTTVYTHFGDKLALYRAVAERAVTLLDVDFDQLRSSTALLPEEKLAALVRMLVEALTSDAFLAFHRILILEAGEKPILTQRLVPGAPYVVDAAADILLEDALLHHYDLPDSRTYAAHFVRIAGASLELDALLDKSFRPDTALIKAHAHWVTQMFLKSVRPASVNGDRLSPAPPPPDYLWLADRLRQEG